MKISIITPTYNSEKVIERCISSLLNQTHTDFEHVIVDNVSSDSTVSIIQNVSKNHSKINKLKVICEIDNGIAEAFNKGINNSDGDIIGILNSDDYYYNKNALDFLGIANKSYFGTTAKSFFPKDKRNELIKVPSCKKHNEELSKLDEKFRFFFQATF